jgi:cysteine desulfurase
VLDGGGQERGLRPGTLNVPAIVGLGAAAEICASELTRETERARTLRDRLMTGLLKSLGGVTVNGTLEARLARNLHVSFEGVEGESLLMALGDLAVSSGSACTSGSGEPSHVLRAIGLDEALARASIRFGVGRFSTAEEIDFAISRTVSAVQSLRHSPLSARPAAAHQVS